LPVLFHQSFLAFCQKYKDDLTQEQREALLDVNNGSKGHHAMAPEIKRELLAGKSCVDLDQKMDVE
jgi:essential nuclear protein 1